MKRLAMMMTRVAVAMVALFGVMLAPAQWVMADSAPQTSIISCPDDGKGGGIFCILNIVLDVLTWGVGIAGTLGIVICGIQYLTARDNEQQLVKAKSRLFNIVIGLALYAVMWAVLQFLLPGGVFGTGS